MEKSNFWNDACRGGAIIGLVMAVSNVAEQAMLLKGGIGMYGLVIVEWLALAGVFICGPDLFSRFWNYNTYVEIVWSNLVLLLPVCFSVVYFKKNREEEK